MINVSLLEVGIKGRKGNICGIDNAGQAAGGKAAAESHYRVDLIRGKRCIYVERRIRRQAA